MAGPEAEVKKHFTSQPAEAIERNVLPKLIEKKNALSRSLIEAVHENFALFIDTSRDLGSLKSSLSDLRAQLREFRSVIDLTAESFPQLPAAANDTGEALLMAGAHASPEAHDIIDEVRWILELPDQLGLLMAERRLTDAVELLERAEALDESNESHAVALAVVRSRVDEQREALVAMLTSTLADSAAVHYKAESRDVIAMMLRLRHEQLAQQVFLQSRSRIITQGIRALSFEGNVVLYVGLLSRLFFTHISATCDDFRQWFPERASTSCFMAWAVGELKRFARIFKRQVFLDDDYRAISDCLALARSAAAALEARGLTLSFVLEIVFDSAIARTFDKSRDKILAATARLLAEEKWVVRDMRVAKLPAPGSTAAAPAAASSSVAALSAATGTAGSGAGERTLKMSESCKALYTHVIDLAGHLSLVVSASLYAKAVAVLEGVVSSYLADLAGHVAHGGSNDRLVFVVMANVLHIGSDLLPRVSRALARVVGRPIVELDGLAERTMASYESMIDEFGGRRATQLLVSKLGWPSEQAAASTSATMLAAGASAGGTARAPNRAGAGSAARAGAGAALREGSSEGPGVVGPDYGADAIAADASPSDAFVQLIVFLSKLYSSVLATLSADAADSIVAVIVSDVAQGLASVVPPVRGLGGLQQLALDLRFYIAACGVFGSVHHGATWAASVLKAIDTATAQFCKSSGNDPRSVLKPAKWFDVRVSEAMKALRPRIGTFGQ